MEFKITLPIQPHLLKMISKTNSVDPFVIKQRCHYGQIIFSNLKKNYVDTQPPTNTKAYSGNLQVLIANELAKQNKIILDDKTVQSIHQALNSLFYDKLFTLLDFNASGKGDIKENINRFMESYDITEDDLKRETVVKKYYRYRQNKDENDKINFRRNATIKQTA